MKLKNIIIILVLSLFACNPKGDSDSNSAVQVIEYPAEDIVNQDELKTKDDFYLNQIDQSNANDLARFLAGKPVDKYAELQQTEFY